MKNHEVTLPDGYREIYHINALEFKTGLILNLGALVITVAIILLGLIPVFVGAIPFDYDFTLHAISTAVFIVAIIAYMLWHELMHGAAYKLLTGEKLTFGFSWSCAYCGVPDVYVYRRAALIALLAPFVVCGVVLTALTVVLAFVNSYAYIVALLLTAAHFGGCVGDLYIALLYLFRLRDPKTLMRDTGPEQFLYIRESAE